MSSRHGLSLAEFRLRSALAVAPPPGLRRVDRAEALDLTPSGATRALLPLEKVGLVGRRPNERDTRAAHAHLTEAGRERRDDARRTVAHVAREVLPSDSWTPSHVAALDALLDRLG